MSYAASSGTDNYLGRLDKYPLGKCYEQLQTIKWNNF